MVGAISEPLVKATATQRRGCGGPISDRFITCSQGSFCVSFGVYRCGSFTDQARSGVLLSIAFGLVFGRLTGRKIHSVTPIRGRGGAPVFSFTFATLVSQGRSGRISFDGPQQAFLPVLFRARGTFVSGAGPTAVSGGVAPLKNSSLRTGCITNDGALENS